MSKPGFKKFVEGIQYASIPFSHTVSTMSSIIFLEDPYYLIIDDLFHFHLTKNPINCNREFQEYPTPSFATQNNQNVQYSINPEDLYKFVYGRKMDMNIHNEFLEYINSELDNRKNTVSVSKINSHSVIVHFNKRIPPFIFDFKDPDSFKLLPEIKNFNCLFASSYQALFLIKSSSLLVPAYEVLTYSLELRKLKKLKFECSATTKPVAVFSLRGDLCVLQTDKSVQILNLKKNKIIKAFPLNEHCKLQWDLEAGILMYKLYNVSILHILEFDDSSVVNDYKVFYKEQNPIVEQNIPTLLKKKRVLIFYHNNVKLYELKDCSLKLIGEFDLPDQSDKIFNINKLCCWKDKQQAEKFKVKAIPCPNGDFALTVQFCRSDPNHGLQKIHYCQIKQGQLPHLAQINIHEIFSEFRERIECVAISPDCNKAAFLTEQAKLFEVDLKNFEICYQITLYPLVENLIDNENKIAEISHIFYMGDPEHFIIGVTRERHIKTYIFNKKDFSLIANEKFFYEKTIFLTQINMKTLSITTNFGNNNVNLHRIRSLDVRGFTDQSITLDKNATKIWPIFEDLNILTEMFGNKLHLYDNKFKFLLTLTFSQFFTEEEPPNGIIWDIRPFNQKYYLIVFSGHYENHMVIMEKSNMIHKIIFPGDMMFVYHFMNEMIFYNIIQFQSVYLIKPGEIIGKKKINHPNKNVEGQQYENDIDGLEFHRGYKRYKIVQSTMKYVKQFETSVGYEKHQNRNSICIFRKYNAKTEMLNIFKHQLSSYYHTYVLKMVYERLELNKFL